MKKKIIAICLCVALVAVGIVGATLAYFTDSDQVNNTFSIGNVKIDLYEQTDNDIPGMDKDHEYQDHLDYSDIMPGDELSKKPIIENTGDNAAYVRVAVVMNNVSPINEAIDDVYEEKYGKDNENVQKVYDSIFDGWGVSYTRRPSGDENVATRRMWMKERTGNDNSAVLFDGQIDMYCNLGSYGMYDVNNTFKSKTDIDAEGFDYACAGYYRNAANEEERVYVFYLKLDSKDSYQLFDGLNVPTDFTAEQMKMFADLKIGIYADAIQVDNFDDATAAFNALEAAHPLGWWND